MKITALRTFLVAPRWLFLKIETDAGVARLGEPIVEGRAATVAAALSELADYLIGADPALIEDHWQKLFKGGFYRGGPILSSAVAGIDQALWDIAGKTHGVPVYTLLGGPVRDRIRVYAWIGGDDPSEVAEQAAARVKAGFSAVKMNATGPFGVIETPRAVDGVLARVAAVREALGPERDMAIDFHGRVSPAHGPPALAAARAVHAAVRRGASATGARCAPAEPGRVLPRFRSPPESVSTRVGISARC